MFFSCKAQDIRIVIQDSVIVTDKEKILVFQIENGKDTLYLKSERSEYYHLNKINDDVKLFVKYKDSLFELPNIKNIINCIYINYKPNSEENCFVINEMYSDALHSKDIGNLKNCSDTTNIYFYREFEPEMNPKGVIIRKKINKALKKQNYSQIFFLLKEVLWNASNNINYIYEASWILNLRKVVTNIF